jgi:hypothetical protein
MKDDSKQKSAPSQVQHLKNPHWRYTPSNETDVRQTWKRFGWLPPVRRV